MDEMKLSSKEKFSIEIHHMCIKENLNIVDAITEFCNRNNVDMEEILPLMDKGMKEDVRVTAIKNRYVRGMKINELDL
jgi:hypothetical protein